jgi:hypothetical protein
MIKIHSPRQMKHIVGKKYSNIQAKHSPFEEISLAMIYRSVDHVQLYAPASFDHVCSCVLTKRAITFAGLL